MTHPTLNHDTALISGLRATSPKPLLLALALAMLAGCFDTTTTSESGDTINNDTPNNDTPNNDAPNNDVNNDMPNNDPGVVCGDGTCDMGETFDDCPQDCAEAGTCEETGCPKPPSQCDGDTLVTFGGDGTCVEGVCDFEGVTQRAPCSDGQRCELGACRCDPEQHLEDDLDCGCNGPCDQADAEQCVNGQCDCDPQLHTEDFDNCGCTGPCNAGDTCVDGDCQRDTPDFDGDGVPNDQDNCPLEANADQIDGDQDMFGAACDCSDNNGNINPGADEVCGNGIDDNCNDQIDENCQCIASEHQFDNSDCGCNGACGATQACIRGACVPDPCRDFQLPPTCVCEPLLTGLYMFCSEPLNHNAATSACEAMGAGSSMLHFDDPNIFADEIRTVGQAARRLMPVAVTEAWLDLRRAAGSPEFRWAAGSIVRDDDPQWAIGKPSIPDAQAACGATIVRDTAAPIELDRWLDLPCNQTRPFICEVPPR